MTKPRITIDRNGWVRNTGVFPFSPECRVETRFDDGASDSAERAGLILASWWRRKMFSPSCRISHYRIVG